MTLNDSFIARMKEMFDDENEFLNFLKAFEKDNYQALRINPLKTDLPSSSVLSQIKKKAQIASLGSDNSPSDSFSDSFSDALSDFFSPVPWAKNGFYYNHELRPGKTPFHECGLFYIQEPSAMAPAAYLDAKPGEKILDLCAAPGGKSTQIASSMLGKGLLISNEIHPQRARILSENIERMGIRNAIVCNESPQTLSTHFPLFFDKIMVDAPCSGEGMFRKNNEATQQWSLENVEMCAERQDEILDHAAIMLKPGGKIVYSTCTFAPAENEGTIARFLARHKDFKVLPITLEEGMKNGNPKWALQFPSQKGPFEDSLPKDRFKTLSYSIRLWPQHLNGEGHFLAVLEKDGNLANRESSQSLSDSPTFPYLKDNHVFTAPIAKKDKKAAKKAQKSSSKASSEIDLSLLEEFLKNNLNSMLSGNLCLFGQQIYLLPKDAPQLFGLHVLRPGLHLGTIQKQKFEPSHSLALALSNKEIVNSINFSSDLESEYSTVLRFINGETFPYEGAKGWYLITLDHYSIGWGRLAGNIMKNYYPKGLRKVL